MRERRFLFRSEIYGRERRSFFVVKEGAAGFGEYSGAGGEG